MIVWRLDAVHELGGEFSLFFPPEDRERAEETADWFCESAGWYTDVYEEDVPGREFCDKVLPNASVSDLAFRLRLRELAASVSGRRFGGDHLPPGWRRES